MPALLLGNGPLTPWGSLQFPGVKGRLLGPFPESLSLSQTETTKAPRLPHSRQVPSNPHLPTECPYLRQGEWPAQGHTARAACETRPSTPSRAPATRARLNQTLLGSPLLSTLGELKEEKK